MSAEYPTTSIKDWNNTNSLINALAGLGILSLGAGLTWGSAKALLKRLKENRRPVVMQPSKGLHNAYEANRISIADDYFPPEEKEACYRVNRYRSLIKEAKWGPSLSEVWKAISDWWKGPGIIDKGVEATANINGAARAARGAAETISNTVDKFGKPKTYSEAGEAMEKGIGSYFTGAEDIPITEANAKDYIQFTKDDSWWDRTKGMLAQRPKLAPLWFLPAAVGAVGLSFTGGNSLVEWIDDLLGKSKQRSEYKEDAKRIYEESAQFLKDVASGKVKPKMKKESAVRPSPGATVTAGDGTVNPLFNIMLLLGIPAAGLLAKQLRGAARGHEDAQEELADRTHMLWAALAAQKERDYDYNGLYVDVDKLDGAIAKDRRLNKKTTEMRNNMKPDNNQDQLRWENAQMGKIRSKSYR